MRTLRQYTEYNASLAKNPNKLLRRKSRKIREEHLEAAFTLF